MTLLARAPWLLMVAAACASPARDVRARPDSTGKAAGVHATVRGSPAGTSRVDSLLALGDSVYRESPDSARRIWTLALSAARQAADSPGIARALTGIGQAARLLGDFHTARRLGEQALALKVHLDLQPDLFRSYNALALLAWQEERLTDASALLDSAMQAARAARDSVALVKATVNSGLIAQDLGAFDRARVTLERGRDAAAGLHDSATLARALDNLGSLDVLLGDPVAAIASIETARRIARALGDSATEVNALGQLATAYDALGEPQRAFALLDSALSMARRGGRREEAGEDLTLIADLFLDAGDHQHALDYYHRAFVLTDSLGQPEERGNIVRNEARAQAALHNLAAAEERAAQARDIHRRGGFEYPELGDLVVLSSLAQQRGRAAEADQLLRDARAIARRLDAPIATSRVDMAEAEVAAARHDWNRTLRALDRQRPVLALAGSRDETEALALSARAYEGLGQLNAALAAGRRAVEAVERVRGNYASGELRTTYTSDRATIYAAQVMLLLRMGLIDEAFRVADAARGRALLEHLAAARADVRAAGDSGAVLASEELLRRIDALTGRLRQGEARPPRERSPELRATTGALRDSLLAARAEYEALVARTGAANPDSLSGASPIERSSPSEIARSLARGEVLLEYMVTSDRLIIFVVTPRGLTVRSVDEGLTSLGSRVQLARALLRRRDGEAPARGVLSALYDILMQPVLESGALDGATRLVVVPHGPLAYLPTAALFDRRTGHYVAEDYAVLRVPTAASLVRLRAARAGGSSARQPGMTLFAPFPDSLPATRDEVRAIRRLLPVANARLGVEATKTELRRAFESGDIVHVATHARMNARNPLFSAIELSSGPDRSAAADAPLEVHELLGMRIRSPLVFLSGCETALGGAWSTAFDTEEDYTTLAQTLLYAGAQNVVATLWRIDDSGAAVFASRFYAALSGDVAGALARAQRETLADPRYRSPYYWAAYEVSGGGLPFAGANRVVLSDKR